MLSDVLAEALDDIVYYQKTYPDIYGHHASEIKRIKRLMRVLLAELDSPPEESPELPPQPHDGYHGEERDPLRPSVGRCRHGVPNDTVCPDCVVASSPRIVGI